MNQIITKSPEETQKIAETLINNLKDKNVIALYGNLGSGKTTFVKGLAKGLGIKREIISPTFIIVRTYKIKFKKHNLRFKNFYHIDLYRIESLKDIEGLGIYELMDNPENLIVIEWAEKIGNLLTENRVNIRFEYISENERKIIINNLGLIKN